MLTDKDEVAVAIVKPGVEPVDEEDEEDAVSAEEEVVSEETA